MPSNITGFGNFLLRDPSAPPDSQAYISPAFTFTFSEDRTVDISQGVSQTDCSQILDLDLADRQSTFTLTLGTQILDELAWQWVIFNNRRQTVTNFLIPRTPSFTVPAGGAITVTGITADDEDTSVVILQDTAPGNLSLTYQASGGTIDPTNYEVTADTVTVDAGYEGFTAVIYYRAVEATIEVIGGSAPFRPYNNVEFLGKVCGTRFADKRLYLPRVSSLNGVNFDVTAEDFSREFRAFLPPGYTVPYVFFDAI